MPIDLTSTGAGNRHVLTCPAGKTENYRDTEPANCAHRRIGGEHSDRIYFANAYLQFLFVHVDFALLTASSRRSKARRNVRLALASKKTNCVSLWSHH